MKRKLFFSILVLVGVMPSALAAETTVHIGSGHVAVTPVEQEQSKNVQTGSGVVANDSKPMTQLHAAGEKYLASGSEQMTESEIKTLAGAEASALGKLIVANARMQSRIYKVLSPDQKKKLSDLERSQSAITPDTK